MQIAQRASTADYIIPAKVKVSEDCKDFLKRCLTPDPKERLSVDGIFDHPWFAKRLPAQVMTAQWIVPDLSVFAKTDVRLDSLISETITRHK